MQAAWNRPLQTRSSLEGTYAYRRQRSRGGSSWRIGSGVWIAGSNPQSKSRFFPCGNTREQCGTTEGVLERGNYELLTGFVGMLSWWSGSTRRHVVPSQDRARVRAAVAGRWNQASVPRTRQRTSEVGVDSGKARPAPRLVRGGSVSSEAQFSIRPACSIETTSIEADDSEQHRPLSSPSSANSFGTERGIESPTEMPSAPRAQTEGS